MSSYTIGFLSTVIPSFLLLSRFNLGIVMPIYGLLFGISLLIIEARIRKQNIIKKILIIILSIITATISFQISLWGNYFLVFPMIFPPFLSPFTGVLISSLVLFFIFFRFFCEIKITSISIFLFSVKIALFTAGSCLFAYFLYELFLGGVPKFDGWQSSGSPMILPLMVIFGAAFYHTYVIGFIEKILIIDLENKHLEISSNIHENPNPPNR